MCVRDTIAVLRAQLREQQRHRPIHRFRMSGVVRGIVRERAERERIFVDVLRVAEHRSDEIARAHVVEQVTEKMTAEGIVAKVLDHRAAVGEGARVMEIVTARARIMLHEQRPQAAVP